MGKPLTQIVPDFREALEEGLQKAAEGSHRPQGCWSLLERPVRDLVASQRRPKSY